MSFRTFVPSEEYLLSLQTGLSRPEDDGLKAPPSSRLDSTQSTSSTSQAVSSWSNASVFRSSTSRDRLETLPELSPVYDRRQPVVSGRVGRRLGEMSSVYGKEERADRVSSSSREGRAEGGNRRQKRSEIIRLLKEVDADQKPVVARGSLKGKEERGSLKGKEGRGSLKGKEEGALCRILSAALKRSLTTALEAAEVSAVTASNAAMKVEGPQYSSAPSAIMAARGSDEEVVLEGLREAVVATSPSDSSDGAEDPARLGAFVDAITGTLPPSSRVSSAPKEDAESRPLVRRRSLLEDPTLGRMISNAVTVAKGTAAWPPSRDLRRSSSGGLRSAARAEARRAKWREQAEEGLWSMYQEEVLKQRHGALRKSRSLETRSINRSEGVTAEMQPPCPVTPLRTIALPFRASVLGLAMTLLARASLSVLAFSSLVQCSVKIPIQRAENLIANYLRADGYPQFPIVDTGTPHTVFVWKEWYEREYSPKKCVDLLTKCYHSFPGEVYRTDRNRTISFVTEGKMKVFDHRGTIGVGDDEFDMSFGLMCDKDRHGPDDEPHSLLGLAMREPNDRTLTLLDHLYDTPGLLKSPTFSLYLERLPRDGKGLVGELVFGGPGLDKWDVNLNYVDIGGYRLATFGERAFVDTGTNYLHVPSGYWKTLHSLVSDASAVHLHAIAKLDIFTVPCNKRSILPDIVFGIRGLQQTVRLSIPQEGYVAVDPHSGKCYLQLTRSVKSYWILPDFALVGSYLLFSPEGLRDYDGPVIGVAELKRFPGINARGP
ncbi:hypothetical protein FOZ60_003420 [Perkinsus olseni]|uniref:Peptidase A1 domain-containing protein n=1 Tax=Perkinsus olseni TaxID=32597 RepID=A0A7J6NWA4_PEROL|nr:hypothetical protein FOZ60_003420 [Perkinsus olseni]